VRIKSNRHPHDFCGEGFDRRRIGKDGDSRLRSNRRATLRHRLPEIVVRQSLALSDAGA